MFRAQWIWFTLLVIVGAAPALGQEKGFSVVAKPKEMLEQRVGIGERYALIVGISKYANPNINLSYADRDAQSLQELLLDPEIGAYKPENVRLLINQEATRKNVMSGLNSWLGNRVRKEDSVLIFYSGHGALGNGNEAYWVTYDADVEDLYASALSNKDISQLIAALPATRKLTLIDSCYSEATAKKYRALVPNDVFSGFQGAGVVTITASTGQEKSVEVGGHGAFTYHLLDGLGGKGDKNANGVVELDELWSYLNDKVQKTAADAGNKQTPVLLAERMEHGFPLSINPSLAAGATLNQLKKLYGDGKITVEEVADAEQILSQRGVDPELRKLYQDLAAGVLTPDYFRRLRVTNRAEAKAAGTPGTAVDPGSGTPSDIAAAEASPAEATAFHAAELLNTVEGWLQFLSQYPNGVLTERGRSRLVIIQTQQQGEVMAYEIAKASETEEGWRQYLNRFPGGNHIAEAKDHIEQLQAARRRKEREPAAYILAESQNTEEGWTNFIREFSDSQLAVLAQSRLEEVRKRNREKENGLYARALEIDSPPLWDEYIKEFPSGRFLKEAMDKRIVAVKRVEENNQYQTAAKSDTVAGWETYLAEFADTPRSTNARTRIQQLTWAQFADVTLIPGGSFLMGNSAGEGDEKPPHKVELEPFHMGRTEVTNAQYSKYAQETGRRAPAPPTFDSNYIAQSALPVVNITYADAEAFCKWLTEKIGKPVRLPTEAEWEYAARAGQTGALYPWGTADPKSQARYKDNAPKGMKTVAKEPFAANKFGLYNMSGNAAEWVADYYSDNYYKISPAKQPTGPSGGKERVVRGGSWKSGKEELGIAARSKMEPQKTDESMGFRVVIAGLPQ